jgi:hypothetical protein
MRIVKLSLVLNSVLALALIYLIAERRQQVNAQYSGPVVATGSSELPSVQRASAQNTAESKSFSWNQIESADYRVYVANLRGISCPEQTIRDIITADVHGTFAPHREALERKQKNQSGDLAGRLVQQSVETELEELRDEELQLIKELLDPQDPRRDKGTRSIASMREQWHQMHDAISVPLVLQEVDLASLNLDEDRMKLISRLREGFVEEIGGYNQDPNDPEYRKRWQKAQAKSDELFRGMIGIQAYHEYQLNAMPDTRNSGALR